MTIVGSDVYNRNVDKGGSLFVRVKKNGGREYLQIVESYRYRGRVRQRVIGTIGPLQEMQGQGKIDQLLRSLAKYSRRALLLLAGGHDLDAPVIKVGPGLILQRLWERTGIAEHIQDLLQGRRYRFDMQIGEQILLSLRERFKRGDRTLVGNKGYCCYWSVTKGRHFVVDDKKVADDARYDGKWVLMTDDTG